MSSSSISSTARGSIDAEQIKSAGAKELAVSSGLESDVEKEVVVRRNKGDVDEALAAVADDEEPVIIDDATNRRLRRKIDFMVMPMLFIVYGINALGKTTLSYASVTGIQRNLHITGNQYSWLGSAFHFGYLVFEFPAVLLLQRLPLAKYSAFMIVAWGITLTCMAAVENFTGALVLRILLGMCEASVSPGWTLFTSQWYTKEEQSSRTALWAQANGWAHIFGGLVAYGIAKGNAEHGYSLPPWKIIYLFIGLLSVVIGVIFFFLIPDSPTTAWWFSPEDRKLSIERIRKNQQGVGNKKWKAYQVKEALLDPMTWALCLLSLAGDIPAGGLSNFFSLLIVSFHYTPNESLLIGCIGGAVEIVVLLGWAYLVHKFGNRLIWGMVSLLLSLLGGILLVALPNHLNKGKLAGFFLANTFAVAIISGVSMLSTNIAGYTKKTTVAALFFIFFCVGNIIGPQTFRDKDRPNYTPAKVTLVVCFGIMLADLIFMYAWLRYQNRLKEAKRADPSYVKVKNSEFMDLTDKENPEYVYVL